MITATDISDMAVQQASIGRYSDYEIQRGMNQALLEQYFDREPGHWKVNDELRGMVAVKKLNLQEPFVGMGPFDIIFCRNVAIYFTPEARRSVFTRLAELLTDDGFLFVGSAESLIDLGYTPMHHCRSIYYQPKKVNTLAAV